MLRHQWILVCLAILLSACAAPREPAQPAAVVPEVEKQEAAPSIVGGTGVYRAELAATEFAADPAARGQARLWLNEDGSSLHYQVTVAGLGPATSVHMHLTAAAGSRQSVEHYSQQLQPEDAHGPVVVTLMKFKRDGIGGDGVLVKGKIAAADLAGPLKRQPLSRLVAHLDRGEAYVTVHIRQSLASGQSFCCRDGLRGRVAGAGS